MSKNELPHKIFTTITSKKYFTLLHTAKRTNRSTSNGYVDMSKLLESFVDAFNDGRIIFTE